MAPPESSSSRSIRYPAVIVLVVLTAIIVAVFSLLIARFWLFPPSVSPVVLNSQERAELDQKLQALESASKPDISPQEYSEDPEKRIIYLTQRELNAIIANNPDLANKASVHLSEGKISAGLLVTLPKGMPIMEGKTVKVTTGLHVGYKEGRPSIVVEGVSLMGVPLPSAWLGGIKGMDLVQADAPDGGIYKIFSEGVKDLSVEDGRLRVELAE